MTTYVKIRANTNHFSVSDALAPLADWTDEDTDQPLEYVYQAAYDKTTDTRYTAIGCALHTLFPVAFYLEKANIEYSIL